MKKGEQVKGSTCFEYPIQKPVAWRHFWMTPLTMISGQCCVRAAVRSQDRVGRSQPLFQRHVHQRRGGGQTTTNFSTKHQCQGHLLSQKISNFYLEIFTWNIPNGGSTKGSIYRRFRLRKFAWVAVRSNTFLVGNIMLRCTIQLFDYSLAKLKC